ncbi:hypothetical protein [Microbacterium testaceum]|uniref:hypothetical protein n=1 Tax=Microbacterium testaceum TaxID=2033 RepID=UPI002434DA45|nr:hypothetical protein [Microbacterium testaceum]
MDYNEAVMIFTADQDEGVRGGEQPFPEEEAVAHVRNTILFADLVDYGDENTEAYGIVLSAK